METHVGADNTAEVGPGPVGRIRSGPTEDLMRRALVNWLRCPDCSTSSLTSETFTLDSGARDPEEVLEGYLACDGCTSWFPIIGGVPRMLPLTLRETLPETYPAFFCTHGGRLPGTKTGADYDGDVNGQVQIMEAFGFEWNSFADYENDNFLDWVTPLQPEFFAGKFGLDGGCGGGRHAMAAHSYGADVVAMDISPAVDAAHAKARATTGVYVVQGDIFHPPLQPDTFEFVYSIGVIHHTPDPPRAFPSIVTLLRPGGTIACLVYQRSRPIALGVLGAIRRVTTRVPLSMAKTLAWVAAALDTIPITIYRIARRLGVKPSALNTSFPEHVRIYADRTFTTNHTDWLDRLTYPYVHYYTAEEIRGWLDSAGLEQAIVSNVGAHGVTGVGTRPASDVRAEVRL